MHRKGLEAAHEASLPSWLTQFCRVLLTATLRLRPICPSCFLALIKEVISAHAFDFLSLRRGNRMHDQFPLGTNWTAGRGPVCFRNFFFPPLTCIHKPVLNYRKKKKARLTPSSCYFDAKAREICTRWQHQQLHNSISVYISSSRSLPLTTHDLKKVHGLCKCAAPYRFPAVFMTASQKYWHPYSGKFYF